MKIGINLFLMLPHVGGLTNYVMTFLRKWPAYFPEDRLILFTFPGNDELLAKLSSEIKTDEIRLTSQDDIYRHLDIFDILFCPFGSLAPRPIPKPSVITLVDIQERFYPDFFTQQDIINRLYHYNASLKMSDQVITISEFSKKSITRIIGIPEDKVHTIYLSADVLPANGKRPSLPDEWGSKLPFIFYPANDWPHKNHLKLIETLSELKQSGLTVQCVLTGTQQDFYNDFKQKIDKNNMSDHVIHLRMVSREEIAWIYRHAFMLVFPSLFEGFGIPVVEAMASGCPVACSATTSLPEVGGNAAIYFDPMNRHDIADKIRTVFTDKALRDRMIHLGKEQHKQFNSERMVKQHRNIFEKAITNYKKYRYYKQKILDEPLARIFQRKSVPEAQRIKARELLGLSGFKSDEHE